MSEKSYMVVMSIVFFNNILFYFIGKYLERLKWNRFIQQGKLPKPKNNNHDEI
jgi:hypothetical protein